MQKLLFFILVLLLFSFPAYSADDYVIGKGDVLEVSVWGVPEMSRSVVVRPDGKITLPGVGDVVADKTTPAKLSEELAEEMKVYIKQPIVTVSVQQIKNNRVYITGSQKSRVFDMVKETTLLKLLSEIGDLSGVDLHNAYLLRDKKKITPDIHALYYDGDVAEDIQLQAEDIVFLPSNQLNIVYVLGAVTAPNTQQYYDGMRVMDAILAAGGFTEFAKENSVHVISKDDSQQRLNLEDITRNKNTGMNILLKPGDYVIVDESLF